MIVIEPTGGLCNKLRVAFSYWEYAKSKNEELTVIWIVSSACPGFFLDYFEPVKGITFLSQNPGLKREYIGCYRRKDYPSKFSPSANGPSKSQEVITSKFIFKDLCLKPTIRGEVNANINKLGNDFIAIQVRRTDHSSLAKLRGHFTSDEDFCKFLDENPKNNVFISTDNKQSFDFFKQKYPQRIKNDFPVITKSLRHTSLKDSIVCLYTCVYAKKFMPSGWSSFGETIEEIRANLH